MSRARPLALAAVLTLALFGPAAAATAAQPSPAGTSLGFEAAGAAKPSPKPTGPVVPIPAPSPYDPGPRPISIVTVCAANLKMDPPLYQNPKAPLAIALNEVAAVEASLEAAGTPMYVSIVSGPGERAHGVSREIQERMNVPGTFLTIIGTVYDTFSTQFDAQPLLSQAFAEQRSNGTAAVITRFAELSGQAAKGPIPTPDFIAWRPTLIVVGAVLIIGFGYLFIRSRRDDDDGGTDQPTPEGAVDLPESS